MALTAAVDGSGSGAVVAGTLIDTADDAIIWTGPLASIGGDEYRMIFDPDDAVVEAAGIYMLRIAATFGGRFLEFEDLVTVVNRGSLAP